ncbi:MAG: beta-propeller domain-containing protein [Oscillospiraceae bacterium]|nr:beta-propeller domain-containing protein [Oscillospiraceae bacterium]
MKTYDERCADVTAKIAKLKKQRRNRKIAISSGCLCLVAVLVLTLFWPLNTGAPDVSRYADSPYYSLIQRINEATYVKPRYKNNFEKLTSHIGGALKFDSNVMSPVAGAMPEEDLNGAANGTYVEVTDNQVAGVIEADIVKRSDRHIFQLYGNELRIYSIEREKSALITTHVLDKPEDSVLYDAPQMYLSQDCRTVYVIRGGSWVTKERSDGFVSVTALDVTDVKAVKTKEQVFMTGSYLSSRMVGNDLLLMGQYYVRRDKDFSDESTFLPMVGPLEQMSPVAAEDIFAPEELTTTRYTVVCKLDGESLSVLDSAAFLSYSQELYVSASTIYATRTYTEQTDTGSRTMTHITALGYTAQELEYKGSIAVAGSVKNQYSMDEFEGVLRIVTSTTETISGSNGDNMWGRTKRNVNLTCIDLQTMEILGQVEAFAPEGETAESVRFDGEKAYVCTAEVITLTDPVYFFDLSDLENITWKDTGTIDGYSSSLVNFRDGYLLGIGYNGKRELKIEIYRQESEGVESVCAYERSAFFSEEYKSYLIDRENGLIGLALEDYSTGNCYYVLLMFDGYEIRQIAQTPIVADRPENVRGILIDGWLYILTKEMYLYEVW